MLGKALKFQVLILMILLPLSVHAATSPVLFVVDSSGSMWGRIEGTEKVYLVRGALVNLISGFPQNTEIGLIAYGHKKKDNCNGSELLAPIGSPRDLIINRVSSFTPKGKAPIGLSVDSAIKQIKQRGGGGTIVLLSDGGDSCKRDPCRSALASGKDIRIHVLGLDLKARDVPRLSCIAKNGGGKFYTVNSKTSLSSSFALLAKDISSTQSNKQDTDQPSPVKKTADEQVGKLVSENLQGQLKAELTTASEQRAEVQKPVEQKAVIQKAAVEKTEAEKVAAEKAAAEKVVAEKAAAEKAAAEKAAAEKAAAEKAAAEKAEAEKAEAEKVAAEKAEAEKAAAEKAEAEK
ncbi:MAG: VWA domain-containing protein, partial [Mariprofundus sp.]|nr:VWA domain-containing protein [Mariprofundus sp.]